MSYYTARGRQIAKDIFVRLAKGTCLLLDRIGVQTPPTKAYHSGVQRIEPGLPPPDDNGVYDMPGATARMETAAAYVESYFRRPLYKTFVRRAKFRLPKLQYNPKPDNPVRRQSVSPIVLFLLSPEELDQYSEYQSIIDSYGDDMPSIDQMEEWEEYWSARARRDDLGKKVMEQASALREQAKMGALEAKHFPFDLDAMAAEVEKEFANADARRLTQMKASKYLPKRGSAT